MKTAINTLILVGIVEKNVMLTVSMYEWLQANGLEMAEKHTKTYNTIKDIKMNPNSDVNTCALVFSGALMLLSELITIVSEDPTLNADPDVMEKLGTVKIELVNIGNLYNAWMLSWNKVFYDVQHVDHYAHIFH